MIISLKDLLLYLPKIILKVNKKNIKYEIKI